MQVQKRPVIYIFGGDRGFLNSIEQTWEDAALRFSSAGFEAKILQKMNYPFSLKNTLEDLELDRLNRLQKVQEAKEVKCYFFGFGSAADSIAKDYYQYFNVISPAGCILLSTSTQSIHLNNLTCPYLLVYGGHDLLVRASSFHVAQKSVHHHQSRYGDLTRFIVFNQLDRNLGKDLFDPRVIELVISWITENQLKGARLQEKINGKVA